MASKPETQIKACLFDMDGLLINTEDMYTDATNELLAEYNKPPLPWKVKIELQGRPGRKVAEILLEWSKIPITPDELFEKTAKIQEKLWPNTTFLPGALELVQNLKERNVPIALATSSMYHKYLQKTGHLRHGFDLFGQHVVTGDDERIPEGRGKPCPDIFLAALESINAERRENDLEEIKPEETIVFEDGISGVIGGNDAGCKVVWVPHPGAREVLDDEYMKKVIRDGEILHSLEDFDLEKYGLAAPHVNTPLSEQGSA